MTLGLAILLVLSSVENPFAEPQPVSISRDSMVAPVDAGVVIFDAGAAFQFAMGGLSAGCSLPTNVYGSRASAEECTSTDEQTITQCAVDVPCLMSGAVDDPTIGVLSQGTARTNLALWGHDLSNGAWVGANMTCTKTATGLRGTSNSASTCTASAIGGTVLQTVVNGNAERVISFYIKRRTGTGTVKPIIDGVTPLSDISSSLSTTVWKRVVSSEVPGCTASTGSLCIVLSGLHVTSANPVFGFALGTSGDAVDIDFFQNERGPWASSPIETTSASVARASEIWDADILTQPPLDAGMYCAAATTIIPADNVTANMRLHGVPGDKDAGIAAGSATYYDDSYWDQAASFTVEASWVEAPFSYAIGFALDGGARNRIVTYDDTLRLNGCINGVCGATGGGSYVQWTPPVLKRYRLGGYTATSGAFDGVIKQVQLDPDIGTCQRFLNVVPNFFAMAIGDSITCCGAVANGGWTPPVNATWAGTHQIATVAKSGAYVAFGAAGHTLLQQWEIYTRHRNYQHLFALGGINDVIQGHDILTVEANLQTIYDEARADGLSMHPMTLSPASGFSGWTAQNQADLIALNTFIRNYCTSNSITVIDLYNSVLRSGTALAAPYDSGDGLHPNTAGMAVIGGLATAVVP